MVDYPTVQNVDNPLAHGLDIVVNDHLFASAPGSEIAQNFGLSERQAQRFGDTSEDFIEEATHSFSRNSWTGGAGLFFAHRRDLPELANRQYHNSYGVKVSKQGVRLAYSYEAIDAVGTNPGFVISGDDLYWINGNDVEKVSNFLTAPSTATETVTGNTSPIGGIALAGEEIIVVSADGLFVRSGVGSWSKATATIKGDNCWYLKGRMIVADGVSLYEITAPYDTTPSGAIDTLPPGETYTDASDLGSAMVIGATDGTLRTYTGGATALTLDSIFRFQNGYPITVASAYSRLLVGIAETRGIVTNGQVWEGDVSNGQIANLQLIREFNDGSGDHAPRSMVFANDSIYFVVNDSQYDRVLVYNYYLPTSGLHREGEVVVSENPCCMAIANGKAIVSTVSGSLYRESGDYVGEGWITTPFADFFASLSMEWYQANLAGLVPSSCSIALSLVSDTSYLDFKPSDPFDHGSYFIGATALNANGEVEAGINLTSTALAAQIRLRSTSTSQTPILEKVALHAYAPIGDFLFRVPINVSDLVRRPGKADVFIPGYGEEVYRLLRSFLTGIVEVQTLRNPTERFRGVVENVSIPVVSNLPGGARTTVSVIVVRGRPSSDLAQAGPGAYASPKVYGLVLFGGLSLENN